ncbi:nucleotide disphospho-sugar-binding domain-containing protein [Micromonospora sp. NPDC050200]|uniref:nucleotide disphospho-sugar-binding domain-containing protein n=1 Tax=Micromonospora sp. NPDC050200 TaxID=3155664 RepID=UPI0033F136B0
MRVMLTVSAWPTHYMAMVPTAWALQSAGHEVRVVCAPSQVRPLRAAGLIPVPVLRGMSITEHNRLEHYRQAVEGTWPFPWLPPHPFDGTRLSTLDDFDVAAFERDVLPDFNRAAEWSFDETVRFAAGWRPDVVLHDPISLEGLLAAKALDLPCALFLWGPIGTSEPSHVRLLPADRSGSFVRYGLGPFGPHLIENIVDPCPASMSPPSAARRFPVRYVPYNGSASLVEWTTQPAQRPRFCLTWSTALTTMSGPDSYLLPRLVQDLADLDLELVVTATDEDVRALGAVPPGVRVLTRYPINLLLPSCAGILHHGGAGATMTAVAAGVPQVVVGFTNEQITNGARVAATGAAINLPGHHADTVAVRQAVRDVIGAAGYRARASALRQELLDRPTPHAFVETLEKLASG